MFFIKIPLFFISLSLFMSSVIALSIVETAAQSDYLAKAIAKSTGKKINEVRDLVIAASGASAKRDAANAPGHEKRADHALRLCHRVRLLRPHPASFHA